MAQGGGCSWFLVLVLGHFRRDLVLGQGHYSPVLAQETLVLLGSGGQVQLGQQKEQQQE